MSHFINTGIVTKWIMNQTLLIKHGFLFLDKFVLKSLKLCKVPIFLFSKHSIIFFTSGNIVFSPFSLHTALSMTLIGSPKDSNTHKQLSQALFGIEEFDNDDATTRHSVAFFSNWNAWQENGFDHTLANLSILSHLDIRFTYNLVMEKSM